MVSSVGTGSWYSMPSWGSDQTPMQDLTGLYADSNTSLITAFNSTANDALSGQVNLAAQAAAKRLGVTLPSSSGSTSSSASAASAKKTTSTSSSGGATSAHTNIDQFLASLDGNPPVPAASASGTNGKFDLNTFLTGLDKISMQNASSPTTPAVPQIPSGKNFSVASYLKTLDSITTRPLSVVNVTS